MIIVVVVEERIKNALVWKFDADFNYAERTQPAVRTT